MNTTIWNPVVRRNLGSIPNCATWLQFKDLYILRTRRSQNCLPLCCLINLISPAYSISIHPWDMLMVMSLESMEGKITQVQNKLTAELPGFFFSQHWQTFVLTIVFSFLFLNVVWLSQWSFHSFNCVMSVHYLSHGN